MQEKILIMILIIGAAVFMGQLNLAVFSGDHGELAKFFNSCIVNPSSTTVIQYSS